MCVCRDGWHGGDCAVPSAVWSTPVFRKWYSEGLITRRSRPRAVFNGISLNHELDMLEIHVNELSDAVDRYVVVESNTTFFGDAKPLYLQSNLNAGFLGEHAHKIVPLTVGEQKCNGCDPFWQEYHSRNATWLEGQRWLGNISDDDLFLLTDADELPNRDVVLFLKHHDGYGEPIGLTLRWFLYGFFWERRSAMHVYAVCTVGFLRTVCANDPVTLRQGRCLVPKLPSPIHRPRPTVPVLVGTGTVAHQWVIQGARPRFSGWHCSWCFNAQGIQVMQPSTLARTTGRGHVIDFLL
ncbi:beta-1,4-mannosyl-glycoprotein 4-beta-N-acetylglucosaminyltransferase [Dermacentor silvarum]|uniref:beta-1,4-mannosyl-glycoprotein 4-beta-N-acetylglucosaminyltransferase n=1 Tax=Dermacentor silvarum TaxID=543639 RepID=UPI0021013C2D|nr:beta-1,4-mannosyl-glycoprotein 4-beta-N-acetylglucosaminyltransferase [Dermacentor silvarum]